MNKFGVIVIKVISAIIISIVALFFILVFCILIFVYFYIGDHPNHKRKLVFYGPLDDGWTQLACTFRVDGIDWPRHKETWRFSVNIEDRMTSLSEGFVVSRFVLSEDDQLGEVLELDLKELNCTDTNNPNCAETYKLRLLLQKKTGKNLELRGVIDDRLYYAGIDPRISGKCRLANGAEHLYRDSER
ncbi:hypothetical protein [Ruegeria arenilitoris]|uniref:hypothetical protein n=1 Tax=Ruegeria arenilitoris TaxID=1173585 RepID=UPI001480877D|nr:hypothetical protein [Ruegeria arenilitoris]